MNQVVKKSNPNLKSAKRIQWAPGNRIGKIIPPEGHVVRWCHDTPENIIKKQEEGWKIYNKTIDPNAKVNGYEHQINDSNGLTSTILKRNELVAMILPENSVESRKEYYQQQIDNLTNSKAMNKTNLVKMTNMNPDNFHSIDPESGDLVN
jgi:hypothetical protein